MASDNRGQMVRHQAMCSNVVHSSSAHVAMITLKPTRHIREKDNHYQQIYASISMRNSAKISPTLFNRYSIKIKLKTVKKSKKKQHFFFSSIILFFPIFFCSSLNFHFLVFFLIYFTSIRNVCMWMYCCVAYHWMVNLHYSQHSADFIMFNDTMKSSV